MNQLHNYNINSQANQPKNIIIIIIIKQSHKKMGNMVIIIFFITCTANEIYWKQLIIIETMSHNTGDHDSNEIPIIATNINEKIYCHEFYFHYDIT